MVVLMCEAAGNRLVLPVQNVVEVIARPRLEPLVGKPDWFAGLVAYRGQVTPVVELARLMGGDPAPPMWSNRIVVVRVPETHLTDTTGRPTVEPNREKLVGLLVDRAAAEAIDETTFNSSADRASRAVTWGSTRLDDRGMFCTIELASILTPERLATIFP